MDDTPRQLWLELPPPSDTAPRRLLVLLHPAGSTPELLAPLAIAWQLKFPGATAVLLEGGRVSVADPRRRDWFDPTTSERASEAARAADEVAGRIALLQRQSGLDGTRTVLVGVSQGAMVALEIARRHGELAAVVVGYATRLARPLAPDERIGPKVHLLHGEHDSIVPVVHARRAFQGLQAAGATVTLDVVEGLAHGIDQEMVNLGTWRVMKTLFAGRHANRSGPLH